MLASSDIRRARGRCSSRIAYGLAEFDPIVPRLLEICRFLNCKPEPESAGLHVTLGVADEATRPTFIPSVTKLLWRFEPVLFGLVHPLRLSSRHARPLPDLSWFWQRLFDEDARLALLSSVTKYNSVNLQRLLRPERPGDERVEFRLHESTLDTEVVRHWVVLLNRLIDHAASHVCKTPKRQTTNDRNGLEKLFITIGLKANSRLYTNVAPELIVSRRYLLRRWRHLSRLRNEE